MSAPVQAEAVPSLVDDHPFTFVAASAYSEAGLHALAATRGEALILEDVRDQAGSLIGWNVRPADFRLQGYTGEVTAPAPRLSFLQFMDLFTETEQLAIAGAAMTDPATKLWYDRAVGAQFIALDDPRLATGLQAFVDAELIDAHRRDQVLQGQPPA